MSPKRHRTTENASLCNGESAHSSGSPRTGFGFGDLRKFIVDAGGVLPFIFIAALAAGLALSPAVWVFQSLQPLISSLASPLLYSALGLSLVLSYLVYGLSLLFVAPILNLLLGARLKPFKGSAVSFGCVPWYIHASLTLVVRYTFLEFITPTPFSILYYRMMGMKIGRNVWINSTAIADPSLIELEDGVTIGGSASLMAHYAQGGNIVIEPVKVCRGATIGLRAIIMGGVVVGARAKVLAGSFVLPNSKIPPGETWAGIPARRIDIKKLREEIEGAASGAEESVA